ncbi:hypothetical protein N0V88_004745 [Collariella sp. IMI 366227]|nr:hypothetical protein N0V88_004745 [Collariella sp. IMI 366227]
MAGIFGKSGSTAGRAKTRTKTIRGTISAPIPIPQAPEDDEFPIRNPGSAKASVTADDEFPMRMPGTGIATPLPITEGPGTSPDEMPEQATKHGTREQQGQMSPGRGTSPESSTDREDGRRSIPVLVPASAPASSASIHPASRTANGLSRASSTRRTISTPSGITFTTQRICISEELPIGSVVVSSFSSSKGLARAPTGRSTSLPLSEYDRPLRSHSIGPDDIMAIESARTSLQAEAAGSGSAAAARGRRRAATTGAQTLLRPHLVNREWGAGLSPRPASAQGRASRATGRSESEDPNEIGRAITSDNRANVLRRRSRSLSGLEDFPEVPRAGRRRSDEIRYWRASYDPGFMSPLSLNVQEDIDDAGAGDLSTPGSPAVEMPQTPPQPFNFHLLSKEMVGTKITRAADMATRLGDVESRTLRLERVVDQLCHAVPAVKGGAKPKDQIAQLRSDLAAERAARQALEGQVKRLSERVNSLSTTMFAMVRRPSDSHFQEVLGQSPFSAKTARPLPPRPEQPSVFETDDDDDEDEDDADNTSEGEAEGEGTETQPTDTGLLFALARRPSESHSQKGLAPSQFSTRLAHPLPPRPDQPSAFDMDDDNDPDEDNSDGADVEAEGEGTETQPTDYSGSMLMPTAKIDLEEAELTEDDFQTPREGRTPMVGYDVFGDELVPEYGDDGVDEGGEAKRRRTARTLSLGQLTLGKGQRGRV